MNWDRLIQSAPGFPPLEREAADAGRNGRCWWPTWQALHERLTHVAGAGASIERFRDAAAFEAGYRRLYRAWAGREAAASPWRDFGEEFQAALFDTAPPYQ
jgi:hypothetical protein